MKKNTKGLLIGGGVGLVLIAILIIRKTCQRDEKITPSMASKMSDKELKKQMKKSAESGLNVAKELKKRLCDKDPNQEGC